MSRSIAITQPVKIPTAIIFSESERNRMGKFALTFDLLEILSKDRMLQLVKEKMLEANFEQTDEGLKMPKIPDGVKAVFDLENMCMNLKVSLPEEVVLTINKTDEKALAASIEHALEEGKIIESLSASYATTKALNISENNLEALALAAKRAVNDVLKEVYRQAIKEKAATIGNVTGVTEHKEGSTYRIRVEISD